MFEKKATTATPIHEPLANRWSGRAYDPHRPVPSEALLALLEAARWTPSCFGHQPWRVVVWKRDEGHDAWRKAIECLSEGNRSWASQAPVLLLACADRSFADGRPNRWCQYDTGAAIMSLSVQATATGLMIHQMGGFDPQAIRAAFSIPDAFDCLSMITVGYQLPEAAIPETLREREYAARSRRELDTSFFLDGWGQPFV